MLKDCFTLRITRDLSPNNMELIIAVIILLILAALVFVIYRSNNRLDITKYAVADKNIPKPFDGFLIVQLSDFHNTRSKAVREQILSALLESEPDIIVITGDFIDYYRTDTDISLEFLRRLISVAPVYYIPGNHEARIDEYPQFCASAERLGARVLDDCLVSVVRGDSKIDIVGVKDPYFYKEYEPVPERRIDILSEKLKSLLQAGESYTVLLSHRPELAELYADSGVDLALCGHAHGGQFRLPFVGGVFSPGQGLLPKYTCGLYETNGKRMIVSRGIGNSSFPFRINNSPELVLIRLENIENADSSEH
ncbi:MAG: metallophosphoesterase [Acutalibacteraceae bacterium]